MEFADLLARQLLAKCSAATRNVRRRVGSSVAALVTQSGLFLAQVFLPSGVNADYVAIGDKQRNHDLEASFKLGLLP
jgi:hypothetical protein